jgi:hypothetical protein
MALSGAKALLKHNGFKDKSIEVIRKEYEQESTLVKEFLNDKCVLQPNDSKYFMLKPALIQAFFEYCTGTLS